MKKVLVTTAMAATVFAAQSTAHAQSSDFSNLMQLTADDLNAAAVSAINYTLSGAAANFTPFDSRSRATLTKTGYVDLAPETLGNGGRRALAGLSPSGGAGYAGIDYTGAALGSAGVGTVLATLDLMGGTRAPTTPVSGALPSVRCQALVRQQESKSANEAASDTCATGPAIAVRPVGESGTAIGETAVRPTIAMPTRSKSIVGISLGAERGKLSIAGLGEMTKTGAILGAYAGRAIAGGRGSIAASTTYTRFENAMTSSKGTRASIASDRLTFSAEIGMTVAKLGPVAVRPFAAVSHSRETSAAAMIDGEMIAALNSSVTRSSVGTGLSMPLGAGVLTASLAAESVRGGQAIMFACGGKKEDETKGGAAEEGAAEEVGAIKKLEGEGCTTLEPTGGAVAAAVSIGFSTPSLAVRASVSGIGTDREESRVEASMTRAF